MLGIDGLILWRIVHFEGKAIDQHHITPRFQPFWTSSPTICVKASIGSLGSSKGTSTVVFAMEGYSSTASLGCICLTIASKASLHRLGGYQRHVMADCYSRTMSVVLAPGSKMTRMACWAHLRREVYEHHKRDPQVIALPLALMNQLYDTERRAMMSDLEFAPHSNFKCFTTLGLHLYRGLSLRKLTSSSWIAICYATCCIAATEPFVPDI